jgi:hypothetical protein
VRHTPVDTPRRTLLAVLALFPLGPSGLLAVQDGAWDASRTLEVVDRAIDARQHAYADTTLRRFEAHAQGHVYFLGDVRGEREVARADQVALEVRWHAPDNAIQTIVGRRHEVRLPTRIQYHIDHLSLVLHNFGDRIALGDGDEVWDVRHPASRGARELYEYRLSDSLEIRIRDRAARVYRLDVRPRDPERPAVVGSMYVDRETGALARLQITFTAAAYRDPEVERITLDLRSGLWDGKYWLPAEQDLEITRSLRWLDFPLVSVIRTRLVVQDYDLDPSSNWVVGPGHRVATLPPAYLERFDEWDADLYAGPLQVGDRSDEELALAMRNARALVRPWSLERDQRLQFSLPNASSAVRLRRAEGVFVGGGGSFRIDEASSIGAHGGYATGTRDVEAALSIDREFGAWTAELEGFRMTPRDAGPLVAASGVGSTLGLVLEGEDYLDPYFEHGGRAGVGVDLGAVELGLGASYRSQRSAALVVEAVFASRGPLRAVRAIDDGDIAAIDGSIDIGLGEALGARWSVSLSGEAATTAVGDFGYSRAMLALLARRDGLGAPWAWSGELIVGTAGGQLPAQRLYLLGGRGTLPGYAFRQWGGDRVALFRGEVSRQVAWPWLNLRLVGAAGRVEVVGAGAGAADRFGVIPTAGVRSSLGGGVGLLYDLVRLDVVKGLGGSETSDPVAGEWSDPAPCHRGARMQGFWTGLCVPQGDARPISRMRFSP